MTNKNDWPEMVLTPIGKVQSPIKAMNLNGVEHNNKPATPATIEELKQKHKQRMETVSEILIFDKWESLLDGIEGFSHILVLYWPHLIKPDKRNIKAVHPMGRKEIPLQGIFATCSPARPNPVLVSVVRLMQRKKNKLIVKGLEAFDNSPVIDIKPHSIHYLQKGEINNPEWMVKLNKELYTL